MTYKVDYLNPDTYFSGETFLDKKFILTHFLNPITTQLLKDLAEWNITEIYCNGRPTEKEKLLDEVKLALLRLESSENNKLVADINQKIKAEIAENKLTLSEGKKKLVKEVYAKCEEILQEQLIIYATTKKISFTFFEDFIKDFSAFIFDYSKEILQFQVAKNRTKEQFILDHALRSTILSVLIGKELNIGEPKLTNLGIAACLHEIGMMQLSPQMYIHENNLSASDRKAIHMHPVFSYSILDSCKFPSDICIGVLGHHEYQNGKGYPRKLCA
ncbi:MAG: HD-GYP domain-containing protein, partial [Treponemataceae bacterium]